MNEQKKENRLRGSDAYPFVLYQMPFSDQSLSTTFHWQEDVEILSVKSGKIELTLDSVVSYLYPGDIVCINPGQLHGFRGITEDTQCDIFIFSWEHLLFIKEDHNQNQYLKALVCGDLGLPLYFAKQSEIRTLILKIIELQRQRHTAYEMLTKAYLLQLVALIAASNEFVTLKTIRHDGICKEILMYIQKHYMENLTVPDISNSVGISQAYFSTFFAEHFHIRFSEYLRNYRIEQACELLANTSLSITEIALVTGFCSGSHFIHVFNKIRGITPLGYRKKISSFNH